jgi:uncharacterized protein YjiS (DUF1127 family)
MVIQIFRFATRLVRTSASSLVRYARRRHTRRLLSELSPQQLRDIGLTRADVTDWSAHLRSRLTSDTHGERCRRALSRLDQEQLSNLSEAGRRAWRAARRGERLVGD